MSTLKKIVVLSVFSINLYAIEKVENFLNTSFDSYTNYYFVYQTVSSSDQEKILETIKMYITLSNTTVKMKYESYHSEGKDIIQVVMDKNYGNFINGEKLTFNKTGSLISTIEFTNIDREIFIKIKTQNREKNIKKSVKENYPLVLDVGLLSYLSLLMQEKIKEKKIYIISFSGHIFEMDIKIVGEPQKIGEKWGECVNIEGTIDLFFKKIVTKYWITNSPPYFLIKFMGVRGLFHSPIYITTLVSSSFTSDYF